MFLIFFGFTFVHIEDQIPASVENVVTLSIYTFCSGAEEISNLNFFFFTVFTDWLKWQ